MLGVGVVVQGNTDNDPGYFFAGSLICINALIIIGTAVDNLM